MEPTSTTELVQTAAGQISTLVRDELALARSELVAKGKRAGIGGGLFGGAALLGGYGLGLAIALAVVGLDAVWPLWAAILVVMLVLFAVAGVMALVGKRQISRATPPVPSEAAAGLAADVQTVKEAITERRHHA